MRCTRALPAAALILLALAGCTAAPQPEPSPTPTQPFALAIDPADVLDALGPLPPDEPPSAERMAAFRQTLSDMAWNAISSSYPDAERYTGPATYLPDAQVNTAVENCVAQQGLALPEGGTSDEALVKASSLARYVCAQQFVVERGPGLSEKQVAYLYDYQTEFVLPCYSEKGYPVLTPPIARAEYVAKWPFQYWSPEPSRIDAMGVEYDQLNLMCPAVPEEWD